MNVFVIGETDFGVNVEESYLRTVGECEGQRVLQLEVVGDTDIFDHISEAEEWSWALYPPKFYLRGLPVPSDLFESEAMLSLEHNDAYECSLYMMEHNAVRNLEVKFYSAREVELRGNVDLLGHDRRFSIRYAIS
jgi:hypothetical protein